MAAFDTLSIFAVVFASLSALFGAYFVLFSMAIWATYRFTSEAHRRLRLVTIALFIVLVIHYIARATTFAQSRVMDWPGNATGMPSIPLTFIIELSSTLAGTLSDGLLAWRFYVVHDRARWARYVPTTAIAINTMLGLSGNFQHLSYYHNPAEYMNHIAEVACNISAAWGWCMLGINTILSGAMIYKILHISRTANASAGNDVNTGQYPYSVVLEAILESSLITWIGLLLFGICSLAPQGRITTHLDVGYVMGCMLPMFFGISQCLITTRLGFAVEMGRGGNGAIGIWSHTCNCAIKNQIQGAKGLTIMVHQETEIEKYGESLQGHKVDSSPNSPCGGSGQSLRRIDSPFSFV